MLNELDKELERRGHQFVRYADDSMILCKSKKSAERMLEKIIPFMEGKLLLMVNKTKTETSHISKVKFLLNHLYYSKEEATNWFEYKRQTLHRYQVEK